ncbi:carboxymuconolactone decarboxylase family protein [Rhizobium multihospitium]|uniref:4-carboxymuconolactone decarboxylase n=1 Tax=Rhizobium multihospitium TaxID=410764 RepID=A0A1C3X3F3_9HYPH|nr:carboxymuconolactone decarboxylase family protein [Rhizobium multihospitium]SCB46797.1 4-carboxymuconolactone decarboxylase [Rhizobium multihospitium]
MMDSPFENGLKIRREVVGAARVEESLDQADAFSRPLQELTTSFAWGQVWSRDDDLDRRSRSLLTIAMLIALNRPDELKVHMLGGLNNGLTPIELREAVLHAAVYCGFPAALAAMKTAQQVLAERRD